MKPVARLVLTGTLAVALLQGAVLGDAASDYEMLFGAESKKVTASKDTADDAAFARKLLGAVGSLGDSPALQVVLYRKAYEFGIRNPAGHVAALKAIDLVLRAAPDEADDWEAKKLKLLEIRFRTSTGVARKSTAKPYLDTLLAAARSMTSRGNLREADKLYARGFTVATYLRSPRGSEIAAERRRLAAEIKRQHRLETLRGKLAKNPGDKETRLELVLFYLLEMDSPAEAVKVLSDDLDVSLRTYVGLAAKPVNEIPESGCLKLGGWYEQLAAKAPVAGKPAALRRAAAYYRRYLAIHTKRDAMRLKATMALRKVEEVLGKVHRAEAVKRRKPSMPKMLTLDLGGGVTINLVLIRAGKFLMGSPPSEKHHNPNEAPQHEVSISTPFYLGVTEVTQEQYAAVVDQNPRKFKGPKTPAEQVSWTDAVAFCKAVSKKARRTVRLPTEAEWEYSCRAGTQTRFYYGDDPDYRKVGYHAWYKDTSSGKTHPVGQKKPNAWGLYDMHGNVWEWCSDWYDKEFYAKGKKVDPENTTTTKMHVLRGGSWYEGPWVSRSASRITGKAGWGIIGFRVVVSLCPALD